MATAVSGWMAAFIGSEMAKPRFKNKMVTQGQPDLILESNVKTLFSDINPSPQKLKCGIKGRLELKSKNYKVNIFIFNLIYGSNLDYNPLSMTF